MTKLIHIPTGHIGEFIKEYKPTGMSYTTQIRLSDGRIYYAPSHEFKESTISNDDLNRGITGNELLERVIPRIEKLYDK